MGAASQVRIQFPWGSLLRGLLSADHVLVNGVAGLLRPAGELTVLASVTQRDRVPGITHLDPPAASSIGRRIAATAGLSLRASRQATHEDIVAAHSTWAKRLGAGRTRPAWLWRFTKP